jgi:hypothetical protein
MRLVILILILATMDCRAQPASPSPTYKELKALIGAKTSSDQFKTFVSRHHLATPVVDKGGPGALPPTLIFSNGGSIAVFVSQDQVSSVAVSPGDGVDIKACLPHTVKGPLNRQSIMPTLPPYYAYYAFGIHRGNEDGYGISRSSTSAFDIIFYKDDLDTVEFYKPYVPGKKLPGMPLTKAGTMDWYAITLRTQTGAPRHYDGKLFLYLAEFTEADRSSASQFCVREDGSAYRDISNSRQIENDFSFQLTNDEVALLHREINALTPPDSMPRNPAFIVSFLKNSVWYTYTYDESQIPDALRKIIQVNRSQQGGP